MNAKLMQNRQMRSIAIAVGAAIFAAVATMFVPASVLEGITGASGLSELVPATAAPLGDTARALIAFGTGALTLALMAVVLLRQSKVAPPNDVEAVAVVGKSTDDKENFAALLKQWTSKIQLPKLPWLKGEGDITELSDLPKLRGGDIHPDAPARRPLSATSDLPVLDLTEMAVDPTDNSVHEIEPITAAQPAPIVSEAPPSKSGIEVPNADQQPSLSEMVAQLEASVSQRKQQLVELEIVAAKLAASKLAETPVTVETIKPEPATLTPEVEMRVDSGRPEWPPLEAVPATPAKQDDMDEALAAALATLHRMNGTGR